MSIQTHDHYNDDPGWGRDPQRGIRKRHGLPPTRAVPVTDSHGEALRVMYRRLPAQNIRWQTKAGAEFLSLLGRYSQVYTLNSMARAIGVTPSALQHMLSLRIPAQPTDVPRAHDCEPLIEAFRAVQELRTQGRQVRRTTPQYRAMHFRLASLMRDYGIAEIAAGACIPPVELRRFTEPPRDQVTDKERLADLRALHGLCRARRDGGFINDLAFRRFLRSLASLEQTVTRIRIARALGVETETVAGWLRMAARISR